MSITYGGSVEALNELLCSEKLRDISAHLSQLANGIDYIFVEITCNDDIQYGLLAYGKEALELHRKVLEICEKQKEEKPVSRMVISL